MVQSAEQAFKFFEKAEFNAAVIKPNRTDKGLAVYTNLVEYSHFKEAFETASKYGTVILQEHAKGDSFRLTVIDGKVVTVSRIVPFYVNGDGVSSVNQLLDAKLRWRAAQEDYQGFNDISPRAPEILFMLEKQSLTFQDILAK